ncbi:hypothetical protein quinque_010179 [Culex quinquefasciatus]
MGCNRRWQGDRGEPSLEQNSAMGALYEANWDKVQSSMNSLIESHHVLPGSREDTGKLTPFRELDEDDEGLPDEDEDDAQALKRSSTVLKALNGYRPSTIRRIRNRQFPEWDELKEPSYSEENLDTIRPHSSRKPFANTHRPLPPIAVPGHNGYRLQHQLPQHPPASKEYRMYANIASSESFRGPSPGAPKGVALKRSNTVAVQPGGSTDMYRPRTLDRRDVFQRLKEKVRQQKPIDEFSDHQRSYGFPANAAPTKTNSRYKPSAAPYCDSKNSKSLESISTFPDFRRGSDDSESNLSIGDRMTGYRSSSDLCSQIYREDDKSFRNIPKATATLSRNKSVKGRPILDDIPADLLPRSTDSERSKKSKKVGFGKMLYNTISAGTKFPRALLKNHFNKDSSETSEYDSFSYRDSEPPSPYQSQSSPSSSKSNSSASSSSSFKKLFRSRSRSNRRQQGSSSSSDSADSFLVPTPEERPVPPPLPAPRNPTSSSSVAAAVAAAVHQNIVPGVHTYARKRRTGNLNAEPIYGNLEEVYDNENEVYKYQVACRYEDDARTLPNPRPRNGDSGRDIVRNGQKDDVGWTIRVWAKQLLKRRSCRCGNATTIPGPTVGSVLSVLYRFQVLCRVKFRGCRNPHRVDGRKVRPHIPELQNLEINLDNATASEALFIATTTVLAL